MSRWKTYTMFQRRTSFFPIIGTCLLLQGCQVEQIVSEPLVIGYVTNSEGFPVVKRNNQEYILARQSKIYTADIFDTSRSAKVEMSLINNTTITIGQKSHLVIHRFIQDEDSSFARLTLTKGTLLTKMGNPCNLELQTPLAVIHSQGADIYANFAKNTLEVAMISDGTVLVSNDNGKATINSTSFGTTVIAGSAPQTPHAWTLRRLKSVIEGITFPSL